MLQKVVRSTVIDAPIERVWAVLRDFNSHDRWHDVVAESRIEGGERGDQVGCVRSFTLKDGNRIREQLIALSDEEHISTYCIVDATVPLQRYVATVHAEAGDRRRPHVLALGVDLRDAARARARARASMVARDVYEAGFENLRRYLRQGGDGRAAPTPDRRARRRRRQSRTVASSCAPTAAPRSCRPEPARRQRPAAGEVRDPPARDRRQLHRHLPAARLDPGDAAARHGGALGMEAGGQRSSTSGDGVSGLLPGDRVAYLGPVRAPTAACARCRRRGSCACPRRSRTTSPRRPC